MKKREEEKRREERRRDGMEVGGAEGEGYALVERVRERSVRK